MQGKRGFTLIELLAVIVILAIIAVIAVPQILKIIDQTRISAFKRSEEGIISAAKNYLIKNVKQGLTKIGDTIEIELTDLAVQQGSSSCTGSVLVTKISESKLDYTPHINCGNQNIGFLSDNLEAYYKLDNNSIDYSERGYHCDLINSLGASNRFNQNNRAITLGLSKYIDCGDRNFDFDSVTVSLWNKANTNNKADSEFPMHATNIIGKGSWNNAANNKWYLGFKGAGENPAVYLSFVYGIQWTDGPSYNLNNIDISKWNHFVGVATPTSQKLYINGEVVSSVNTSHATVVNWDTTMQIGNNYTWRPFNGSVDDVRIYSRALSDNEVANLYKLENTN